MYTDRDGESANSPSSRPLTQFLIFSLSFFISPLLSNGAEFYNDWATNHLSSIPAQSSPTNDPDADSVANLAEFAFGTDPLVGEGLGSLIVPGLGGEDGVFAVELFEQAGHRPGLQIDLEATADMTHWVQPWWLRTTSSLPGDPQGSVRERFTTYLPGTNTFIVRARMQLIEVGAEAANYYVATNGNDGATGTSTNQPFATLRKAVGLVNPGDLVYVRGGTYVVTQTISMSRSGSAAQPIRVRAYPGERPVFDFSTEVSGNGLNPSGNYWHLYGLETIGAANHCILVTGHSNVVELCSAHDCRGAGIEIYTPGSYNLILNCDSYHNYDATNHGENADGFVANFGIGPGNVFRGCRSWQNSDDGWDLWSATNSVVISNCWSWGNGSNLWNDSAFAGDGNGFKLGGDYFAGPHRIMNCVAFGNLQTGFDQNNNTAGLTIDQNTAWNNTARNFNLKHGTNTTPHVVRNNVSFGSSGADLFWNSSILSNNSWQILSPAVSTSDVLSVDTSFALAPRRDDGGLPEVPFLRPVPGGRLVDKGADLGAPFSGSAPDLGAFETLVW